MDEGRGTRDPMDPMDLMDPMDADDGRWTRDLMDRLTAVKYGYRITPHMVDRMNMRIL